MLFLKKSLGTVNSELSTSTVSANLEVIQVQDCMEKFEVIYPKLKKNGLGRDLRSSLSSSASLNHQHHLFPSVPKLSVSGHNSLYH